MAVEVGSIVEGKITGVKKFGAFVALPGGQTGMVHISEVSNEYIQELSDVLSEGQTVKVKVMSIMRVTGAADPTVSVKETLKGKLPQKKLVREAAHGYSSYGNQIGLATGYV